MVEGENLVPVTFVRVRWQWLSLLGSQIVLSVAFLVAVIVRTADSGLGVTKSSLLPALFAINAAERALIEASGDSVDVIYQDELTQIANDAKGIVGQFSTGEKRHGWILRHWKEGNSHVAQVSP